MVSAALFSPRRHALQWHWGIIGIMLLAFMSQLSLQSLAYVGESPRATLYRLTSIDIAPHSDSINDLSCLHEHHRPSSAHHHDGDCPLCPLLGHILFTLLSTTFLLGVGSLLHQRWKCTPPAHAPPRVTRDRPPSRAPPFHPEIAFS